MTERTYTREDMARAWDEGWNTCKTVSTLIDWGSERPIPNPYREQEEA